MKNIQLFIIPILLLVTMIVKGQKNELNSLKFEKVKIDESIQLLNDSLIELNSQSALIQNKIDVILSNQVEISNDWGMKATLTKVGSFREEPTKFSAIIEKLEPGTIVDVLGYDYSYFKVLYNSNIGYIDASKEVGNKEFDICIELKKTETLNKLEKLQNSSDLQEINGNEKVYWDNGHDISIEGIRVKDANSAGGVGIFIQWRYNNPSKTLKYIYFTFVPYNDVGDVQVGEIKRKSYSTVFDVGPLQAKDWIHEGYWDNIWYNSTITCVKLSKVKVEYMDGTSYTYVKELPKIFGSDFNNKCKYVD